MVYLILIFYFAFSLLSWFYILSDKLPKQIDYIIILSASSNKMTKRRIAKGVEVASRYPTAKILFCGKKMSSLFQEEVKNICNTCFVNNESTNTYEDALYGKRYLKNVKNVILITSSSHQRRARNTFHRVYRDMKIYNISTNDIFTLYSPFLPTGWVVTFINLFKDWKYNSRKV